MKNKVLNLLKSSNDYISGQYISDILGVSRNSIWKYINALKNEGYCIEGISKKGYKLISSPDTPSKITVDEFLKTSVIGKNIYHFKEVNSTNIKAKELALKNATEGTVICSDIQTSGKGRFNRVWGSPLGGLWTSIILRPNLSPIDAHKITLIAAASVFKMLDKLGIKSKIKWPNDIYLNNKKLCGILTTMSCDMDIINYVIVGIGININIPESYFVDDLSNGTSMLVECKKEFSRAKILASILNTFEEYYNLFIYKNNLKEVISICRDNSLILSKNAKLVSVGKCEEVTCITIDDDGELLVKDSSGNIKKVISGEITFK